jgi:hypothetical protein
VAAKVVTKPSSLLLADARSALQTTTLVVSCLKDLLPLYDTQKIRRAGRAQNSELLSEAFVNPVLRAVITESNSELWSMFSSRVHGVCRVKSIALTLVAADWSQVRATSGIDTIRYSGGQPAILHLIPDRIPWIF